MSSFLNLIHDILWEYILIYFLLGVGIYFSFRLKLLQIRCLPHMFVLLKQSHIMSDNKAGISALQALCISIASRVGTGNLTGVAIAISLGGPGAIFWMCLIALIGMATSLVECTLAQVFKIKDQQGLYRGGPAYYIEKGLGSRGLGITFSICLIVSFGFVFNAVQANSIGSAMHVAFGVETWVVGLVLVILTAVIILGDIRRVGRVAAIIVPFMAGLYILLALFIVITNLDKVPAVVMLVVDSAFGLREASAGALGYTIAQAMLHGIKRGLFSNEAGMGSAPNAAASATAYPNHPATQGFVQMLGVFFDTLVVCTATAAIILLSGQLDAHSGMVGIELTQQAMTYHVGSWGEIFIAVAIFFFAFTSLVGNYAYAETNIIFLGAQSKLSLLLFRLGILVVVMLGAISELAIVWRLADVSMGLMALINLFAISLLSGLAFKVIKDYSTQLLQGKKPEFDVRKFPELKGKLGKDIWDD